MKYKYNDSELLYLVNDGNDIALGILYYKYFNLIHRRLHAFRIKDRYYDDFFQEGLMMMHTAINTYSELYGKTFNKYFDLLLQRRIMTILKKDQPYIYNVDLFGDCCGVFEEKLVTYNSPYLVETLDPVKSQVYDLRFVKRYSAKQIAKMLGFEIKKVYNLIYHAKKQMLEDNDCVDYN